MLAVSFRGAAPYRTILVAAIGYVPSFSMPQRIPWSVFYLALLAAPAALGQTAPAAPGPAAAAPPAVPAPAAPAAAVAAPSPPAATVAPAADPNAQAAELEA